MPILDLHHPAATFSEQVAEARRFFLPHAPSRPAAVLGGGFERVAADYRVDRARLAFMGLEFVVSGNGTARLKGAAFDLIPGTFFVYGAGSPHRIVTDPKRPLAKYFVDLDAAIGRRLMREMKLPVDRAWLTGRPADVTRLLEEIVRHGTSAMPQRQEICDALLRAVLLHAAQSVTRTDRSSLAAFASYQRCCGVIDGDAVRLRSLEEVARECELDPAYICRLFRRFDRQTPYQRLLRNRMNRAATLLYGSDALVKQIAAQLAYADVFHFSRSFKSVFGLSPEAFRAAYARKPEKR